MDRSVSEQGLLDPPPSSAASMASIDAAKLYQPPILPAQPAPSTVTSDASLPPPPIALMQLQPQNLGPYAFYPQPHPLQPQPPFAPHQAMSAMGCGPATVTAPAGTMVTTPVMATGFPDLASGIVIFR